MRLLTEEEAANEAYNAALDGWYAIPGSRRRRWSPQLSFAWGASQATRILNREYEYVREIQATRAYLLGLKRGYRAASK